MKLCTAAISLVALVCGGSRGLSADEVKGKSWRIVQPEISLGALTKDQVVSVNFEVRNDQDVPLKIVSTDVSCRCTSLDFAPDVVPPHSSEVFRWKFSASRAEGVVKDTVVITGDDGHTLVGTFKAYVSESRETPR